MADIPSQLRAITRNSFTSNADREFAVAEARALLSRIESPWETAYRQSWIEPARMASLEITNKLDIWKKWAAAGGSPKSIEELSKLVTCDHTLLSRVIWQLAGAHMLEVVRPGVFGLTPFTAALAEGPQIPSTVSLYIDMQGPALRSLPSFVQSTGFQNPTDHVNGLFRYWTGKTVWDWLKANPETEKVVGTVMQTYAMNRPSLSDIYPTGELINSIQDDTAVLVDCGGSIGHDLTSFAKVHGKDLKPGSLILQDQPVVIEEAGDLDPTIKKMDHDFFTPQPIKGATAYYMHFVLHDWPDSDCKRILENLKLGMRKGYSKLLLHEVVLDPNDPKEIGNSADIVMMMASGMERTAAQWTALLESTGFKINRIYNKELAAESVIEAELV
ncbi:putative O-methyltransferase [Talaromyces proteolyticus]|uniref:O-methyltransferase n=1 Tax=Talaromyces proteolyticus TaxID=1131652 RepID=A0AAD4KE89_9EURO|nr:putative O-methyltransferase [Talaromyces proteolyticus]KAH8689898.1 putative O-methyltransferase [Talaromyces proteolyticus]